MDSSTHPIAQGVSITQNSPIIQGYPLTQGSPATAQPTPDKTDALLGVYEEICKSHQGIDEFRVKLLGFLPLASLAGIFLLSKSDSVLDLISGISNTPSVNPLIAFIGIFAAAFTLALFIYEIRGILRCHGLIVKGKAIEERLGIIGQFSVCHEEHEKAQKNKEHYIFNAKVAACFTYSLVFAAWIFLALHRGFGVQVPHCTLTALAAGLILGLTVHHLIDTRIPA
jgi:hypothetical protein